MCEQKTEGDSCCGQSRWCEPKFILSLVGMLLLTSIVVVAVLRDRIVNQPQWQVNVLGQGRVSYVPDIANVTLGVQIDKSKTAEEALNQLNDKIGKIIKAVKEAGVQADDITTQNYSLYTQYDYRDNISILAGYNANQQLVIKVRNIANDNLPIAKVIAEASKAGANQVSGVTFDVSKLEELKQEARLKALQDAKAKSGGLAAAVGVRLGEVVGWWENVVQAPGINNQVYYGEKGGMGGGAAPTPQVPSGSQEIVIEVTLNYKLR